MQKRKCKHKPRVKIVKEKEFTFHRHHRCMTRKCPLCGKKIDSTKLLNCHVMEEHDNYQFLCKFCKCRRSYSSRNSADRHTRHHSSPRFMCDACGKQFMSLRLIKMSTSRNFIHVLIQNVTMCTSQQLNIKGI